MPKTPKNKKRRVKVNLEQRKKKAKRLKFEDEDEPNQHEDGESVASECIDEEGLESDKEEGEMLEKMLEEHADKNNLSAINVKSILHHVITDRRVLELVQKIISEKEREQSGDTDDVNFEFEPKMTRSKYRQKNLEDPISQLTRSPLKKPVSTFTDLEFPESSSDEEYHPNEDEEDEDTESCVSAQSDLASPFKPATPDTVQSESIHDINTAAETTSPSVSRPFTRHRSQEKIFKKPGTTTTSSSDQNDLIAKRTRSLLPLTDKELQYDIQLPDFSPDLYDQINLDELDEAQIAFQQFLQSIANGNDMGDDDEEYDFMAENSENVEEKEEYRNDRAVRIPKKEVSDLFAELLKECKENEDDDTLWSARSLLLDAEDSDNNADTVMFTDEQRTQLSKQMNQHVQLLAQVYLLSREEPSLQEEADFCRQFVSELQGFCDRSLSVHPIMALGGNMPALSIFDVPEMPEAVRIINEPFNHVKRPRSPRKQPSTPIKNTKSKSPRLTLPPVSSMNQSIMANSPLFKNPILLPRCGFMDKELLGKKESSSLRVKFTETEDNLLAFGMKQFHRNWKVIQANLLPVKTPKQLQIRCKNLHSSRSPANIVKHLRDTKTLLKIPTQIRISCDADNGRRFGKHIEPDWLINYRQRVRPQKRILPPTPKKSPKKLEINRTLPYTMTSKEVGEANIRTVKSENSDIASDQWSSGSSLGKYGNNETSAVEQSHKEDGCFELTVRNKSPDIVQIDDDDQPSNCDDHDNTDHMDDDTAPFTPVSQDDKDDSNHVTSPGPTEPKTLKSSPVSTTGKSKPLRDKMPSATTLSSNSSKKVIPNLLPLPPDPKEQVRAQALADSYLGKVKNSLQDDQEHYEAFLATLVESSAQQWTPAQLYKRMEIVLEDYPELIEDFVAFLEPEQAMEAGVLMENLEFIKARTFLRRLEVHFHKHRAHFQKIIEVFGSWSEGARSPLELRQKVIPLLRGQQHLVDEFQSFFDHLKPPPCCDEDFEEVEIGSGSDPEVDDFEEVVIPKQKGKLRLKQPPNPPAKNTTNKPKLTPRPIQVPLSRNTKLDKRRQSTRKSPQSVDSTSRDGLSEGEEDASCKKSPGVSPSSQQRHRRTECDEFEQDPSSVISEGPSSVASSFHNDTSNDSVKHEDQDYTTKERWPSTLDDANDDDADDVEDDGDDDVEDDADDDADDDDEDGDESDNYDDIDESAYDDTCDDGEDGSEYNQGTLSAQNHQLDQDGQLVVLWTRDDDRTILSVCHNQGASPETFDELARSLEGKTVKEIKKRFEELMKLYEADNVKDDSSSEEEDVEEEDVDSDGSDDDS